MFSANYMHVTAAFIINADFIYHQTIKYVFAIVYGQVSVWDYNFCTFMFVSSYIMFNAI